LGGKFQVENGNGGDRDDKLKEFKVQTWLIIAPQQVRFMFIKVTGFFI